MINYVEIFLNDPATTRLDLNQEFDIALQYSVADIRDITKRNAAFSKTIILPGTKNNNYWLGNLYDINADFTFFNPNVKTSVSISVNSEVVMKGFLQLRKIKKLVNVDHQGNTILYEVVIFNNTVDLMTELGEKTLNQLNLEELNHTYNKSNIVMSWTQSWTHGYVYPMYGLPNGNPNIYSVTDFYPSYYSKYLLNQIFQEAGFGWEGSLKTNPQFEREIIPWVGSGSQSISDAAIEAENFRVGITQSATFSQASFNLPPTANPAALTSPSAAILARTGNSHFRPDWQYSLPVDNFQNPFNPSNDFYDNGGDWNTTLSEWTTSVSRKWAPVLQTNFTLEFKNTSIYNIRTAEVPTAGVLGAPPLVQTFKLEVKHGVEYQLPGTTQWLLWPNGTNIINKEGWSRGSTSFSPSQVVSEQILSYIQCSELFIPIGTKVRIRVSVQPRFDISNYQIQHPNPNNINVYLTSNIPRVIKMSVGYNNTNNYFLSNGLVTAAQEGDPIESSQWLNPKIKQKDFITDLIKRYNLFIQVSPTNERLLILDTRQDFYDRVLNLDWTKKKDYSSEDEITLLSELQFKEMLFTMKPDTGDQLNKDYTALTGDIYGQYKYIFGNEFVKGEQKTESPFSPTPLVKTGFGAVVPGLSPQDPKVNPRILYWGGLINAQANGFTWEFRSGLSGNDFWTQYPYAGHFDNPFNPTLDIHFGTPAYMYYYEYGVLPTDTMYETYWASYVNQIEDGKLVKSKFYLDEFDIQTIKDNFWAKIFILDSYYYVNKIIDYKPMSGNLTTVELIKIKDGFKYVRKPGKPAIIVRPPRDIKDPIAIGDFGVGNGGIGLGGGLVIGSGNKAGGKLTAGSYSYTPKQLVLGDDNFVSGDQSGVIGGSRNIVESGGSWLIQSSDTKVTADNVIAMAVESLTFSEAYNAHIGRGVKADTTDKPSPNYDRFTRGINLSVENYNVGQSNWRVIPDGKEVQIQSGKEALAKEISVVGHLDIEDITGTYSIGAAVEPKRGLVKIDDTISVEGLLTVGGELWLGVPIPPIDRGIGVFYSTRDQVASGIDTPTLISLDTTTIGENIRLVSDKIIIAKVDYYRMTVTILLENLSASPENVIFWLKFNGVDYPLSSHFTTISQRKSAGVPSDQLISYEFIGKSNNPNDYLELYWQTTSTNVQLKNRIVSGIPQSPSVVVNINKI